MSYYKNKDNLEKVVEHENKQWSKIFNSELKGENTKLFSSFWWKDYYDEITYFVNNFLSNNGYKKVLEAGSGSGKASLLLNADLDKTLLDISTVALEYAKYLNNKINNKSVVNFFQGNIFKMPFGNEEFDFVWNIGVVEHYEKNDIKNIIEEMIRVCKKNGTIAIGIPNFYSGPILKAYLLKKIKFIPGYKLDTENFYNITCFNEIIEIACRKENRRVEHMEIKYFGNPLIMETPAFFIKTVGKVINKVFYKNKFLILIICKFK